MIRNTYLGSVSLLLHITSIVDAKIEYEENYEGRSVYEKGFRTDVGAYYVNAAEEELSEGGMYVINHDIKQEIMTKGYQEDDYFELIGELHGRYSRSYEGELDAEFWIEECNSRKMTDEQVKVFWESEEELDKRIDASLELMNE